jgi:formylmethanofuran dehydrogenase subunit E
MNARGLKPTPPKAPDPTAPGTVQVQKRQAQAPSGLRTKACDRCGRSFQLAPEEKFFICRECYEADLKRQQAKRKRGTSILSLIHCAECGSEEYLDFLPSDPAEALCRACFGKKRREQRTGTTHPHA